MEVVPQPARGGAGRRGVSQQRQPLDEPRGGGTIERADRRHPRDQDQRALKIGLRHVTRSPIDAGDPLRVTDDAGISSRGGDAGSVRT